MHLSVWHWTESPIKLAPLKYCEKSRRASRFLLISWERFRKARRVTADPGADVHLNWFNPAQRKWAREVFRVAAKTRTPIVAFMATRWDTLLELDADRLGPPPLTASGSIRGTVTSSMALSAAHAASWHFGRNRGRSKQKAM
jgi:hypothetical protein